MTRVRLHPLFEQLRGTLRGMVFRLSHNGKISAYLGPDMKNVKWSPAQIAQRERMAEASAYGKAILDDPELRAYYTRMSLERKGNKRPYDMAISDYHDGNNLLGDRFQWNVEHWRAARRWTGRRRTRAGRRR